MSEHTWIASGNCTTTSAPNIDDLTRVFGEMMAEKERIDRGLVAALRDHIAKSGESLYVWSVLLRIFFLDLVDVLDGKRPPTAHFWGQVEQVFRPAAPGGEAMTDLDALLAEVIAGADGSLDDDTRRLVYADCLEESGQPGRAEFIRVQVEFALLDRRPVGDGSVMRRIRVGHRAKVLLEQGWRAWAGPAAAVVPGGARFEDYLTFRRGFVESLACPAADWLAHADALCWHPTQTAPVEGACPGCGGDGRVFLWGDGNDVVRRSRTDRDACPVCRGSGAGPGPRPCPPTAHPVRRVVLTTWPAVERRPGSGGLKDQAVALGRPERVPVEPGEDVRRAYVQAVWPGVAFEFPPEFTSGVDPAAPGADRTAYERLTGDILARFIQENYSVAPVLEIRLTDPLPLDGWTIEIDRQDLDTTQAAGYPAVRAESVCGRLTLAHEGLPRAERGERVGPLTATDRHGRRWRCPAVIDRVRSTPGSPSVRGRTEYLAYARGPIEPAPGLDPDPDRGRFEELRRLVEAGLVSFAQAHARLGLPPADPPAPPG